MPPVHGTIKDCTNKFVPALFFLVVVGCITVVLTYSNGIQEPVPRDVTAGLTATLGILVFLFALGRGYLYLQPTHIGHDLENGIDRLPRVAVPLAPQAAQIHSPGPQPQSHQTQVQGSEAGGSPSGSSDSNRITVTHPAPGDHVISSVDHVGSGSQEDTISPPPRTSSRYPNGHEDRASFETPTRIPCRPAPVRNAGGGYERDGGRAHCQNQPRRHPPQYRNIGTAEGALGILPSTWGQQHVTANHPSKSMTKPVLDLPPGPRGFLRNSEVGNVKAQEAMVEGRHQMLGRPIVGEGDVRDSTSTKQCGESA